jgi:hypothetical protein
LAVRSGVQLAALCCRIRTHGGGRGWRFSISAGRSIHTAWAGLHLTHESFRRSGWCATRHHFSIHQRCRRRSHRAPGFIAHSKHATPIRRNRRRTRPHGLARNHFLIEPNRMPRDRLRRRKRIPWHTDHRAGHNAVPIRNVCHPLLIHVGDVNVVHHCVRDIHSRHVSRADAIRRHVHFARREWKPRHSTAAHAH